MIRHEYERTVHANDQACVSECLNLLRQAHPMAAENDQPRAKEGTKRGFDIIHIQDLSHAHAIGTIVAVNGAVLAVAADSLDEKHAAYLRA
jgi:hypothetical protein